MQAPEAYEPQQHGPSLSQHPLNLGSKALWGFHTCSKVLAAPAHTRVHGGCLQAHPTPGTSYQGPWVTGRMGRGYLAEGKTDAMVKSAR